MTLAAKTVIARLQDQAVATGAIKFAGGAGSIPAAADQVQASPSAFVMPPGDSASGNEVSTAALRQTVTTQFRVLLVVLEIGAAGTDQTEAIDVAVASIIDALLGWTPNSEIQSPIELVASALSDIDLEAGYLIYTIDFSSRRHVRKT